MTIPTVLRSQPMTEPVRMPVEPLVSYLSPRAGLFATLNFGFCNGLKPQHMACAYVG